MKSLRVSSDIVPVSEFKAQAATLLERLAETGHPLVITQNGKPAGVVLSPEAFDALTERARFIAAVEEGLEDSRAGRTVPHDEVVKMFSKKSRRKPRSR